MKNPERETLLYVKILIAVILFGAILSFVIRIVTLVQNSSFKGSSFNALLIGKDAYIVHIDASNKKIVTIKLTGARNSLLKDPQIIQSEKLGVLIDGSADLGPATNYSESGDLLFKFYKYKNINDFDILKMYLYSLIIPASDKTSKDYNYTEQGINETQDNLLKIFGDDKILKEGQSLEIVNATNINGLATSIGTALKSIGFNVVSYKSSDETNSEIVTNNPSSDSARRLSNALRIPIVLKESNAVSDITLIIGDDLLK